MRVSRTGDGLALRAAASASGLRGLKFLSLAGASSLVADGCGLVSLDGLASLERTGA